MARRMLAALAILCCASAAHSQGAGTDRAAREAALLTVFPPLEPFGSLQKSYPASLPAAAVMEKVLADKASADKKAMEEDIQEFTRLNPGKADVIRTIVANHAACKAKYDTEESEYAAQIGAHVLSDEELDDLINYFSGRDYERYAEIVYSDNLALMDEADAIRAKHPETNKFNAAGLRALEKPDAAMMEMGKEEAVCDDEAYAAFKQKKLKFE